MMGIWLELIEDQGMALSVENLTALTGMLEVVDVKSMAVEGMFELAKNELLMSALTIWPAWVPRIEDQGTVTVFESMAVKGMAFDKSVIFLD